MRQESQASFGTCAHAVLFLCVCSSVCMSVCAVRVPYVGSRLNAYLCLCSVYVCVQTCVQGAHTCVSVWVGGGVCLSPV